MAAGPVLRCDELLDDAQLQANGSVVTIDHPTAGPHRQLGLPWRMDSLASNTAARRCSANTPTKS